MQISIARLRQIIKYLPKRKSIMLKAIHGVGKTEIITQLAKELGLNLIIWHASHAADAGDITGLPYRSTVTYINAKTGETITQEVTRYAPPTWIVCGEPCLVLLDEINRGIGIVINALMQFTNDGTYDGITLPEGSRIVACVNPRDSGKYDVARMDDAQLDRFAIYDFMPTVEEWISYIIKKHGPNLVTEYIRGHERDLDPGENEEFMSYLKNKDCAKTVSRRSWETVVETFKNMKDDNIDVTDIVNEELVTDVINGIIGDGATISFMKWIRTRDTKFNPIMLLDEEWTKAKQDELQEYADTSFDGSMLIAKNCGAWLKDRINNITDKHVENFCNVLESINPDASIGYISDVLYGAIERKETEDLWVLKVVRRSTKLKAMITKATTAVDRIKV